MRTGTEPPVLNIENRVIYRPDLMFMILYMSIYIRILNFIVIQAIYLPKSILRF